MFRRQPRSLIIQQNKLAGIQFCFDLREFFVAGLFRDPALLMKRELFWIPLHGWFSHKFEMIPVDRDAGPSALRRMLQAARKRIKDGREIIIFPEGTRGMGKDLLPFKRGGFLLRKIREDFVDDNLAANRKALHALLPELHDLDNDLWRGLYSSSLESQVGSKIDQLVARTRKAGGEIVALLKTGSAFYSPSASAVQMAEAILKDSKRVVSCCAFCQDEYDIGGAFVGVPALLGANGVEKVIQLDLKDDEKAALEESVNHVKKLEAKVEEII